MRPSFGANLPQIVIYIWQKAFFKHALAYVTFPERVPKLGVHFSAQFFRTAWNLLCFAGKIPFDTV